jgi:hypothetical protein
MLRLPSGLLFLLLLAILPAGLPAHGTGGPFAAEIAAISESSETPDFTPRDNDRLFAWRLTQHGLYLLSPEQLTAANRAHAFLQAADEVEMTLPDAAQRRTRLALSGHRALAELMETLPQVQRITIDGESTEGEPRFAFDLPGNAGILLFRLDNGSKDVSFVTEPWIASDLDLSTIPEPVKALRVDYVPGAVTWVMLRVKEAPPVGMSAFIDAYPVDSQDPPARFLTHIKSGSMGSLTLDVLDENNVSVPALVNLIHKQTGALYRPSGAIEYAPMMYDISGEPVPSPSRPFAGAGEPFVHTIPGDEGGFYWLVAGVSTMALPVGEWEVRVWKGPEYLNTRQTFVVEPDATTTVTVPMARWEKMADRGWWSGDAHIHSRLMSDRDAERLMLLMEASDLHVGNVVRMGNYARTYFEQRGFGPEFRVQRGQRALVPGQEDPRGSHGHSLALNINHAVRDQSQYLFTDWVARETAKAGGIYGNAHVQYNGFNVRRDMTMLMPQDLTHFGEVLQIGLLGTDLYYDFLNLGFKMTAAAGSDVPFGHAFGEVRYYVYTGSTDLDVDAWFAAMKAGRTFVSNGPMLDFTVNGEGPGADIAVGEGDTLQLRVRAWSAPSEKKALANLSIYQHGRVIASIDGGRDTHELTLERTIPAGFGSWLTAQATNRDGTVALTSPIYVTREGFRRWDHDDVPALLAKAHETLDGWRDEIRGHIRQWEAQEVPWWNMYVRAMAEMGPEQLVRIEAVRQMYADLEGIHQKESAERNAQPR